jgi:hypothetical protein
VVAEQARKQAAEEQARKQAAEEQAKKQAAEKEQARKQAAEEQARKQAAEKEQAAEEQARKQALKEQARQQAAEKQARKQAAEKEQARKQAAENQAGEEQARKQVAVEQAREQLAEEQARKTPEEKQARKQVVKSQPKHDARTNAKYARDVPEAGAKHVVNERRSKKDSLPELQELMRRLKREMQRGTPRLDQLESLVEQVASVELDSQLLRTSLLGKFFRKKLKPSVKRLGETATPLLEQISALVKGWRELIEGNEVDQVKPVDAEGAGPGRVAGTGGAKRPWSDMSADHHNDGGGESANTRNREKERPAIERPKSQSRQWREVVEAAKAQVLGGKDTAMLEEEEKAEGDGAMEDHENALITRRFEALRRQQRQNDQEVNMERNQARKQAKKVVNQEGKQAAEDVQARKQAEEKQARKQAVKKQARKQAAEEQARKQAAEEEQVRKQAAEEQARKQAAEEQARKQAAEEEQARKQAAEEQARKQAVEKEQARKQAAEEQARKQAAEKQARKQAAVKQARKQAAEEQVRKQVVEDAKKTTEESARKEADGRARQQAAGEQARQEATKKATEERANQEAVERMRQIAARVAAEKLKQPNNKKRMAPPDEIVANWNNHKKLPPRWRAFWKKSRKLFMFYSVHNDGTKTKETSFWSIQELSQYLNSTSSKPIDNHGGLQKKCTPPFVSKPAPPSYPCPSHLLVADPAIGSRSSMA